MHEMALCEAIAGVVSQHAGDRPVSRVLVRIGHLRQVVPDALTFSWELLTNVMGLEGCVLDIESVPASVSCASCGTQSTLDAPILACGACESRDVTLVTGEEFAVVSLELADA